MTVHQLNKAGGTRRASTWVLAWVLAAVAVTGALVAANRWLSRIPLAPVRLQGAVIRADKDPKKQAPIPDAVIQATGAWATATVKSDSSGAFALVLRPGLRRGERVTLRIEHAEYRPLELQATLDGRLQVARLEPLRQEMENKAPASAGPVTIRAVRVRYSTKDQTTLTVGSVAKIWEVPNRGNVPCDGHRPCSPDGKWKAASASPAMDAQEGNQFRNVRATCIAGPCPFTSIETGDLSRPARALQLAFLNWSDTAVFLVEAEVTRTMDTEMVRWLYPTLLGQTMSFALPAASEGPSVEADLNGEEIVFPLGPKPLLSWATCSMEVAAGRSRIYRCELKPGFQFAE